jgi:hypothetical protein
MQAGVPMLFPTRTVHPQDSPPDQPWVLLVLDQKCLTSKVQQSIEHSPGSGPHDSPPEHALHALLLQLL